MDKRFHLPLGEGVESYSSGGSMPASDGSFDRMWQSHGEDSDWLDEMRRRFYHHHRTVGSTTPEATAKRIREGTLRDIDELYAEPEEGKTTFRGVLRKLLRRKDG